MVMTVQGFSCILVMNIGGALNNIYCKSFLMIKLSELTFKDPFISGLLWFCWFRSVFIIETMLVYSLKKFSKTTFSIC